jgi:hypothetical protein
MTNPQNYPTRSALVFGNFKEAALLFDRILFPSIDWIQSGIVRYDFLVACQRKVSISGKETVILSKSLFNDAQDNESVPISALLELIFGTSDAKIEDLYNCYRELMNAYKDYQKRITHEKQAFMSKNPPHQWVRGPHFRSIAELYLRNESIAKDVSIRNFVENLKHKIQVTDPAIIIPTQEAETHQAHSVFANLSGIFRVDANDVSWEQILEIRHDKESKEKLPYFRRWCETALTNLNIEQIKDEIHIAENDFKSACAKHGFKYKSGIVSELLDEKSIALLGAGIFTLAAVAHEVSTEVLLEQMNTYLASAAGAGLAFMTVKLGKIGISFHQKNLDYKDLHRDHPIAYLLDIHEKISLKKSDS